MTSAGLGRAGIGPGFGDQSLLSAQSLSSLRTRAHEDHGDRVRNQSRPGMGSVQHAGVRRELPGRAGRDADRVSGLWWNRSQAFGAAAIFSDSLYRADVDDRALETICRILPAVRGAVRSLYFGRILARSTGVHAPAAGCVGGPAAFSRSPGVGTDREGKQASGKLENAEARFCWRPVRPGPVFQRLSYG